MRPWIRRLVLDTGPTAPRKKPFSMGEVSAHCDDLSGKLVAHHLRIGEIGLVAGIDMMVGPAQSDPADPH